MRKYFGEGLEYLEEFCEQQLNEENDMYNLLNICEIINKKRRNDQNSECGSADIYEEQKPNIKEVNFNLKYLDDEAQNGSYIFHKLKRFLPYSGQIQQNRKLNHLLKMQLSSDMERIRAKEELILSIRSLNYLKQLTSPSQEVFIVERNQTLSEEDYR